NICVKQKNDAIIKRVLFILFYDGYGAFFWFLVWCCDDVIIYRIDAVKFQLVFWPIVLIIICLKDNFSLTRHNDDFGFCTTYIVCWNHPSIIHAIAIRTYKVWNVCHIWKLFDRFINGKK